MRPERLPAILKLRLVCRSKERLMSRRSLTVLVVVLAGVVVATAAGFGYGNGMMGTGNRAAMMGSNRGDGPGMMNGPNGYGAGMMGSNGFGAGMMGRLSSSTVQSHVTPAELAALRDRVERQLVGWGYKGFTVGEIMAFSNNDYVLVNDAAGKPAFELLADPSGRWLMPEPGPNMMWNTRVGMMRGVSATGTACSDGHGMMGGAYSCPGTTSAANGSSLTAAQAKAKADTWLADHYPGRVTADATALPGYYTIDVTKYGDKVGMLSVNETTRAVWYHTWHSRFLADQDF
jgi:hypothetical protein